MSTTDTTTRTAAAWDDDRRPQGFPTAGLPTTGYPAHGPRHAAPRYDDRYARYPQYPAQYPTERFEEPRPTGPRDNGFPYGGSQNSGSQNSGSQNTDPGTSGSQYDGPAFAGPEYAGRRDDRARYTGPVAQPRGRSYRLDPVDPAPAKGGSRGRTVAITVGAVLAAAGVAAGLVLGLQGGSTPTPAPTPQSNQVISILPSSGGTTGGGHAITPAGGGSGSGGHVTPPVTPSAAITTLQKELGQLNYYEGPVTGIMNTQTTQAITYLQRDAKLPQTGTMNAATQAALTQMLATGNNQMAG